MKKADRIGFTTLAIKATVYNQIRTDLYGKRLKDITDKDKIEYFDSIFKLNSEAHSLLNNYKRHRKHRAFIEERRKQKLK